MTVLVLVLSKAHEKQGDRDLSKNVPRREPIDLLINTKKKTKRKMEMETETETETKAKTNYRQRRRRRRRRRRRQPHTDAL